MRLSRRGAQRRVDVVFCECHQPDGTWKDILGHIAEMLDPPAFVVTSGVIDAHFRSEVRALGGYDVMTKPLNANEVRRVLSTDDPRLPRKDRRSNILAATLASTSGQVQVELYP